VRKSVRRTWKDRAYVVPDLEFEECPECGERLFDHAAMRKIETYSPAYAKGRAVEKKAAAR
jgi:YgiT-type zinc finger domain-containing protein